MKFKQTCECCGNVTHAHVHRMSAGLANAFGKLMIEYRSTKKRGEPVKTNDLKLTKSQYTNFGMLQNFGVTERVGSGRKPTEFGKLRFDDRVRIYDQVAMMYRKALAPDHEAWSTHGKPLVLVSFTDVISDEDYARYKQRSEYIADVQDTLFD